MTPVCVVVRDTRMGLEDVWSEMPRSSSWTGSPKWSFESRSPRQVYHPVGGLLPCLVLLLLAFLTGSNSSLLLDLQEVHEPDRRGYRLELNSSKPELDIFHGVQHRPTLTNGVLARVASVLKSSSLLYRLLEYVQPTPEPPGAASSIIPQPTQSDITETSTTPPRDLLRDILDDIRGWGNSSAPDRRSQTMFLPACSNIGDEVTHDCLKLNHPSDIRVVYSSEPNPDGSAPNDIKYSDIHTLQGFQLREPLVINATSTTTLNTIDLTWQLAASDADTRQALTSATISMFVP